MDNLIKVGRAFYSVGIIAYGIQQILTKDFRPQIVPVFPAWAHSYVAFPFITGVAFIIIGALITGLFKFKWFETRDLCLYLGLYFLILILFCQIPYCLIISPNKAIHLGVWVDTLKELAFCGGAFVMAGSFLDNSMLVNKKNSLVIVLEKLIPFGRIFFSITMILFGYSHFLYIDFVATLVPKWFGMPHFWAYLGGAALIGSGIAIILKILLKPIALLLAIMLFLWFIFLHVPRAISDPYTANGNEIVSAFDALLFCGIALVIANSKKTIR